MASDMKPRVSSEQDFKRDSTAVVDPVGFGMDPEQLSQDALENFTEEEIKKRQFSLGFATHPNAVGWDGPTDPECPRNWSKLKRYTHVFFVVALILAEQLPTSMISPAVPQIAEQFEVSNPLLLTFVVSVYIVGSAFGPILISPLSELYGRYITYLICNTMYIAFTIACSRATSMNQLIGFRLVCGIFGVCPEVLGAAVISDITVQAKRGRVIALFVLGPLLGPIIAPIGGAYLNTKKSWHWVFYVIAIVYAGFALGHLLLCRETYSPILLERKTKRMIKQTGNQDLVSAQDLGHTNGQHIKLAIVRPLKLLFTSPMVLMLALYMAVMFGILNLLYTTISFVFEYQYNISTLHIGLFYLGPGIGQIIALAFTALTSDRWLVYQAKKHDGVLLPEYRLFPLCITCSLMPIGLFIYGWTVQHHVQYVVPMFGSALFGIGSLCVLMNTQQYLIDAYPLYESSAIGSNAIARSVVGSVLPLSGLDLYQKLGMGWGNSLLGFIALAGVPIPIFFYFFGERIRKRFPINL